MIPETDAGPIVMQGAVAVADDDTAETLAQRILGIEHRIYPEALRLLASGKVRLEGDICKISGQAAPDGTLIWPRRLDHRPVPDQGCQATLWPPNNNGRIQSLARTVTD